MHRIERVRGFKYDLSTFSRAELASAAVHARRVLVEQQRFLDAVLAELDERLRSTSGDQPSPASAPVAHVSAVRATASP